MTEMHESCYGRVGNNSKRKAPRRNTMFQTVTTSTQIKEPPEFGARVTVTRPDGSVERFLRDRTDGTPPWIVSLDAYGYHGIFRWDEIVNRGTVSLGWDD